MPQGAEICSKSFWPDKGEEIIKQNTLPDEVPPEGLSLARRKYLYEEMRQFVKPGMEDYVAPKPTEVQNIYIYNKSLRT